jgi:hypothetical protein
LGLWFKISVISLQSVLFVEEIGVAGENHNLSQVTDKLYHIMTTLIKPGEVSEFLAMFSTSSAKVKFLQVNLFTNNHSFSCIFMHIELPGN